MANGARILLIVGGGIAAYKALELIRELKRRGHESRGVLTQAGAHFITPLSIASLTGDVCYTDIFSLTDEAEMGHIELSRDADLVVVAPATADLIGKMANGLSNDLASTTLLATDKRILIAPAMNVRMWLHPATQRNVETLRRDGVTIVGPDNGEMACGEYGPGRMAEPVAIADAIEARLKAGGNIIALPPETQLRPASPVQSPPPQQMMSRANPKVASVPPRILPGKGPLAGRHVVITSGPTHEPIDPVRYIANRSSGKQGHAIARAAADAGAKVTLVSGPVSIPDPAGVEVVHVESARDMLAAVEKALPADIAIFAAAVADWRVATASKEKIKKGANGPPALALAENPDILATVAKGRKRPRIVIGFAAETQKVIEHARAKLKKKGCDLIVANDVSPETGIMGGDLNAVHLVSADGVESWPSLPKEEVAQRLVRKLAEAFRPA
ncbi:MAG: bifunctional phosphopantothenoylcysteine decarboxylase/phosphopantothenate synthase [Rhizobiales bacterium 65-9]|nr:bifunctional phosphopantothenoylcysteine decarboxylase/phosphopantothenate synthase [Hyphomicrobiales bacterium]OJY37222.1 MAG: bifunctional phosphopantothenoylcysteine decarboxylase/phosphopantothenate synthase [Rhizobiales bacterium 65-9]